MTWFKCIKCGNDTFKIGTNGSIYCARCMERQPVVVMRRPLQPPVERSPEDIIKPRHPYRPGRPRIFEI
ncbi:MAG: hypothetical protein ACTSXJ_07775 [Candidatus Baldrarchaeia archaeon]